MQDEIFVPDERMARYGENCARAALVNGNGGLSDVRRLLRNGLRLCAHTAGVLTKFAAEQALGMQSPEEFLRFSDNAYAAEKDGKQLLRQLRGYRSLPIGRDGRPIVFSVAEALLKTGAETLTPERLRRFLEGVQKERAWTETECELFLPMLCAAAVLRIATVAAHIERVCRAYAAKQRDDPFGAERIVAEAHLRGTEEPSLAAYTDAAERLHREADALLRGALRVLRAVENAAYARAVRAVSRTEQCLNADPTGIYPQMDERSQGYYRALLMRTAKLCKTTEFDLAEEYLREAQREKRHIGQFIMNEVRLLTRQRRWARSYRILDWLLPVAAAVALGVWTQRVWISFAVLLPLWEVIRALLLYVFGRHAPQTALPMLALENGVPAEGKTLVAVALLAADEKQIAAHAAKLEEYYLANRAAGDNVLYGLLADLPDAPEAILPNDAQILTAAETVLAQLRKKHGNRFVLLHRRRRENPRDGIYMAYERKRGAIAALAAFVAGEETDDPLLVRGMEESAVRAVRYLIALDADTEPEPDSVRKLVGAMLHPHNRAVVREDRGRVVSGYGILQPRISMDLAAANATLFSRIFAGQGGTDPYTASSGDVYQNLFGDSIFVGKGIIDLHTMHAVLHGKIADNRVLSHDLLEGSFLRAGFLADAPLIDGFPSSVRSYYKRQARWIRGDVQLLPFLFAKIRDRNGQTYVNPLPRIARMRICDNLRRALTAPAALGGLAIGIIVPGKFGALTAVCALASLSAPMLLNTVERCRNFTNKVSTRCHATIYAGFRGGLLQAFSRFLLLPFEAFITVRAILQALWRMVVTKRNLLEWTTAAEAEKHTHRAKTALGAFANEYRVFLPTIVYTAAIALWGRNTIALLASIFWLAAPAYSWMLSQKVSRTPILRETERSFLCDHAERIWRYFADRMDETDQFLPPDNEQVEPGGAVAHRTSPTNIGLAALSLCSAEKLGLIAWAEAEKRLLAILSAVERMEKYHGHLFNWYDTRALRVLPPRVISSVDMGNFTASLTAVAEICRQKGAFGLALRMDDLVSRADFGLFYDADRKLMRIAVDENGRPVGGHYDMLASEARLTSYFAIAKGMVEKRHWNALSRLLAESGGFSGLASWSGSLFEYLMPNILLPEEENSLLYEAARHAVDCQRREAKRRKIPWGISESAFFAFDEAMNYQYKAHGVVTLGLQNGLGQESVVSPYSSWLSVTVDPKRAIANLRELTNVDGSMGKYGLYEAIDYTEPRIGEERGYRVCKSYMAHHMAMSLCSICNLLTFAADGEAYLPRAFFQNTAMRAHRALIAERMPINAVNVRRIREQPKPMRKTAMFAYQLRCNGLNATAPTVNLAANRSTTLLTASNGMSCLRMGETTAYRFSAQPASGTCGCTTVFFADGRVLSATAYPQGNPACYETILTETVMRYLATTDRLRLITEVSLSESDACEQRTLTLQNRSPETLEGDLVVFLEPLCGSEAEDRAHPAFYRLFLTTEAVKHGVVAVRRNRMGERLCALAMVCDDADAVFTTDGDASIGANDPSFADSFAQTKAERVFGEVRFPVFRMRIPIKIRPHSEKTVRFVLALGSTALAANAVGERILSRPFSFASYVPRMAETLAFAPTESALLPEMLAKLWFGGERTEHPEPTDKDALWALGIGGDNPIVLVDAFSDNNERAGTVFRAVRMHALLAACGVRFDLCLLLNDGNAYERNGFRLCHSAIRLAQAGHLVGTLGGIHLIDLSAVSPRSLAALKLAACADFPPKISPIPVEPVRRIASHAKHPRVWSQPLCNADFGCLSTDFGLTHLWYKNARMVKLTPWESEENGEQLCVLIGGRRISLTNGAECRFEVGYTVWRKQIEGRWFETRACVAENDAVRIVMVACERGAVLEWMVSPLLAEHNIDRKAVVCRTVENGCIIAENPFLRRFGNVFAAFTVSPSPTVQTCSAADWRSGFSASRPIGQVAAFRLSLPPDCPTATFVVAAGDTVDTAVSLAKQYANTSNDLFAEAEAVRRRQTQSVVISSVCTPLNDYLNDWVVWQIKGSRLCSRSSLYQNGGAIGFRDQLQDAMALLLDEPEILRSLVCLCAAHQYAEGDVQHWFHVGFADNQHFNGVRTRCSDDLLWLPLAVSEYVARTGDLAVLAERIPFLSSPPLADGEHERYEDALASEDVDTLYVHCLRALRRFFIRGTGAHGLPLILDGDWNDGMNAVGRAGKGESVWLAWFGAWVSRRFSDVCDRLDDPTEAETLRANAAELVRAAHASFADDRFARAYTDDGAVIGTADSAFCQIDSIAQSFAWFAADGSESEEERQQMQTALQTALTCLVDRELGIVRLFDPPMTQAETIGYLGAYPRGVRENGGQYTHAAVWLAMACFAADRADEGWEILQMLLPATHDSAIYGGEDFVLAADVGGEGHFAGVCGWSWYSGSAAWFRRAVLESMLGIRGLPDGLCVTPNLPSALPECTCRLKIGGNTVLLKIARSANGKRCRLVFTEGQTEYETELM